jgi:hypothetical protein
LAEYCVAVRKESGLGRADIASPPGVQYRCHAAGAKMLRYLYDFGDGWEDAIKIERIAVALGCCLAG